MNEDGEDFRSKWMNMVKVKSSLSPSSGSLRACYEGNKEFVLF